MGIIKELKIEELKKEFTNEEAEALAVAFAIGGDALRDVPPMDLIKILHGAEPLEKWRTKNQTKRTKTAEALGDLFGFPYVSASVNGEAAALWNTNTSAALVGLERFRFLGLAVGQNGEGVGLFQEHNKQGDEVGGVRCVVLAFLPEFLTEQTQKDHEAERVAELETIRETRATVRQMLPKACEILEKYRGKRWGESTREKIRQELNAQAVGGVSVGFSTYKYLLEINFYRGQNWARPLSFCFKWDEDKNTPAEEIKPTAEQLERVADFNTEEHREKLGAIIEELEKTAERLGELIEQYNTETRGKNYRNGQPLSKYGADITDFARRNLDR